MQVSAGLPAPHADDGVASSLKALRVSRATGAIGLQVWIDTSGGLSDDATRAAVRSAVEAIVEIASARCGTLETRFHLWIDRWCTHVLDGKKPDGDSPIPGS